MNERGSFAGKMDIAKAGLANAAREATPYFANYGLTDSALAAAYLLIANGEPIVPVILGIGILRRVGLNLLSNKARDREAQKAEQK